MDKLEALKELLAKVEAGALDGEPESQKIAEVAVGGECLSVAEAYMGSLDSAKDLHEAVLPGSIIPVEVACEIIRGPDPARAWLCAILKALIAQEQEG